MNDKVNIDKIENKEKLPLWAYIAIGITWMVLFGYFWTCCLEVDLDEFQARSNFEYKWVYLILIVLVKMLSILAFLGILYILYYGITHQAQLQKS